MGRTRIVPEYWDESIISKGGLFLFFVIIAGADHIPPEAIHVESEISSYIEWYNKELVNII